MDPSSEMSQKSKNEYIEKMRFRYQARGREGKSRRLDELIEICGVSRKHAIKVMNQSVGSTVNRTETRGRKTIYGANELKVLKVIWLAANQPCGKLLQPMIGMWLPHYEKEHGRLGGTYRKRYDNPRSPADRLLEWKGIDRKKAAWIRQQKRALNPFELNRRVEESLGKAFEINRREPEDEAIWPEEESPSGSSPVPPLAERLLSTP